MKQIDESLCVFCGAVVNFDVWQTTHGYGECTEHAFQKQCPAALPIRKRAECCKGICCENSKHKEATGT